jgi:RimJ/RimL family protein N-acetyltransferase
MTYCLENGMVILKPVEIADLEWMLDLRNDASQMGGSYQVWPISDAEQHDWFAEVYQDKTQRRFLIRSATGTRVGTIALTHIDPQDGSAELGIRIAAGHRRQGFASAAINLLSDWCFREARMHRLYSEVFACNPASMALFDKCGWHRWGVKTQAHWQGGCWNSVVCFELVKP